MAEFSTDTYTNQAGAAGASPAASYPLSKKAAGKLRYAVIPYTVDGDEASGDTINLCKLKVGSYVIPPLCRVISGTGFDVNDMNVGTASNDNAIADAVDTLDTASDVVFTGGDSRLTGLEITAGEETIIAKLVGVVTSTAADAVLFLIAYTDE